MPHPAIYFLILLSSHIFLGGRGRETGRSLTWSGLGCCCCCLPSQPATIPLIHVQIGHFGTQLELPGAQSWLPGARTTHLKKPLKILCNSHCLSVHFSTEHAFLCMREILNFNGNISSHQSHVHTQTSLFSAKMRTQKTNILLNGHRLSACFGAECRCLFTCTTLAATYVVVKIHNLSHAPKIHFLH